jgi:hypothetical protein
VVGVAPRRPARPPPRLDGVALGEAPEAPAALAWAGWTGSSTCVHVVDPSGQVRVVTCAREGFELIGWDDRGIVLLHWLGSRERVETIDPDTGEVIATRAVRDGDLDGVFDEGFGGDGFFGGGDSVVLNRWRDGILTVVKDGPGGYVLWAVEAPEAYRVEQSSVAPDRSVIAGVDSAGRLLLFDAAGEVPPRVWHDDAEPWSRLVWQGSAPPELRDATG